MVVSIFGLILIAIIYGFKREWEGDRRDGGPADLISVPNLTKKCPKTLEFQAKNLYIVRRVKHMTHIRLPHSAIVRSPGLLPMLYTVSEIAAALGVPERTLRDWLDAGAPHDRDQHARIWIHGRKFAGWIAEMRDPVKGRKLKDDEAYCMRCNRAVQMTDVSTKVMQGKLNSRQVSKLWLYDQQRRTPTHLFCQPKNSKGDQSCKVILDWCTEEIPACAGVPSLFDPGQNEKSQIGGALPFLVKSFASLGNGNTSPESPIHQNAVCRLCET